MRTLPRKAYDTIITFARAIDSWNTTLVTGSYELYEDEDVEVLIEGLV